MTDDLDAILGSGDDFVIDFSGVDDSNPPPDTYHVRIEHAKAGTSKAGNKKVTLTFVVIDGEYAGRKLFMHPVLEGKALWKTKKVLRALGLEPDDGSFRLSPGALVGLEAYGTVDAESAEYGSIADLQPYEADLEDLG